MSEHFCDLDIMRAMSPCCQWEPGSKFIQKCFKLCEEQMGEAVREGCKSGLSGSSALNKKRRAGRHTSHQSKTLEETKEAAVRMIYRGSLRLLAKLSDLDNYFGLGVANIDSNIQYIMQLVAYTGAHIQHLHSCAEDETLFSLFTSHGDHGWSLQHFMLSVCPYWCIATIACWERLMLDKRDSLDAPYENAAGLSNKATTDPFAASSLPALRDALQVIMKCEDQAAASCRLHCRPLRLKERLGPLMTAITASASPASNSPSLSSPSVTAVRSKWTKLLSSPTLLNLIANQDVCNRFIETNKSPLAFAVATALTLSGGLDKEAEMILHPSCCMSSRGSRYRIRRTASSAALPTPQQRALDHHKIRACSATAELMAQVIEMLAHAMPSALLTFDSDGSTPLALAASFPLPSSTSSSSSSSSCSSSLSSSSCSSSFTRRSDADKEVEMYKDEDEEKLVRLTKRSRLLATSSSSSVSFQEEDKMVAEAEFKIDNHSSQHYSKITGFQQLPSAILAILSDIGPEAHYRADSNGNYPVHLVAAYSSKEALLRILCSDPSLARQRSNVTASLALHAALANPAINTDLSALTTVYDLYPEAVYQKDWRGHTPLHVAAMSCETIAPQVFEWLLSTNPTALQEVNVHGCTCLHLALDSCDYEPIVSQDTDIVQQSLGLGESLPWLSVEGKFVTERHNKNRLEIVQICLSHDHHKTEITQAAAAVSSGATTQTQIQQQFSSLVEIAADEGELALHTACKNSFITAEIAHLLLDVHPSAATAANIDGNTPLHLAASRRCKTVSEHQQQREVVRLLLKSHPDVATVRNFDEETPYSVYRSCCYTTEVDTDEQGTDLAVGPDHNSLPLSLPLPLPLSVLMTIPPATPTSSESGRTDIEVEDEASTEEQQHHQEQQEEEEEEGDGSAIVGTKRPREDNILTDTVVRSSSATVVTDTLLQREIDATERLLLRANLTEDPQRLNDLNWRARRVVLLSHSFLEKQEEVSASSSSAAASSSSSYIFPSSPNKRSRSDPCGYSMDDDESAAVDIELLCDESSSLSTESPKLYSCGELLRFVRNLEVVQNIVAYL